MQWKDTPNFGYLSWYFVIRELSKEKHLVPRIYCAIKKHVY